MATSADFLRAVNFVIDRLEGGGKIVTDSGGLTRWGISARAFPDIDIASLTRDNAIDLYRAGYWDRMKLEQVAPPLALLLFDAAVNMGPVVAVRFLQDLLHLPADGIIGPETAKAAADAMASELRACYSEIRIRYYQNLAATKPVFVPKLYGWRLRCLRVADEAGRWAAQFERDETTFDLATYRGA